MVGITSFGAYIPRLRVPRKAIAGAHRWLNPGLMGKAKGERALACWDEDALTMGVEAARDCLGDRPRDSVDALYFGSTTFAFADRQNTAIAASALTLRKDLPAADITSSQRAGTTALLHAIAAVKAGTAKSVLAIGADSRKARAASAQELDYGDGAAAFLVGADKPVARFLGSHTVTANFVDHFRGATEEYDYYWEERWIRDEGYATLVPQAIKGALEAAGVAPGDITHFILPSTFPRMGQGVAKRTGIAEDAVRDTLALTVGDTGAGHGLLMLAHALEEARPGDKILLAQFGQGCDALVFEATDAITDQPPRRGVTGALKNRKEETNYMKMAVFKGLLEWEKGMRAEKDNKTALSVLYRNDDMITGLVGGRDTETGTIPAAASRSARTTRRWTRRNLIRWRRSGRKSCHGRRIIWLSPWTRRSTTA
jgi:3-hydroxy-3-methylglutaryl CoA synthase